MIDSDDDHGVDDGDEPSAAALDPDTIATGAAADSAADADDRLKGLPRILRYAMLINDHTDGSIAQRLMAEIAELCPDLPVNIAWAADPATTTGLALAAELDRLAVLYDLPLLRSLGDCARLLSLTLPCDAERLRDFRRVTRAMCIAFNDSADDLAEEQRCDLERFIAGWAALPTAADMAGAPEPGRPSILPRGWGIEWRATGSVPPPPRPPDECGGTSTRNRMRRAAPTPRRPPAPGPRHAPG